VDIQLQRLQHLLRERNIVVSLSDDAKLLVADKGYDPAYGARPLKRVIQKMVQDPLAQEILSGRVKDGDTVNVAVKAGVLVFNDVVPDSRQKPAGSAPATLH
jgi:ATP-dependent Clp protease ATP-binding subunit ClpB